MCLLPATPGYWLVRATEAMMLADEMIDPKAQRVMLPMAMGYEKLAKHSATLERLSQRMERAEIDTSD